MLGEGQRLRLPHAHERSCGPDGSGRLPDDRSCNTVCQEMTLATLKFNEDGRRTPSEALKHRNFICDRIDKVGGRANLCCDAFSPTDAISASEQASYCCSSPLRSVPWLAGVSQSRQLLKAPLLPRLHRTDVTGHGTTAVARLRTRQQSTSSDSMTASVGIG